MTILTENVTFNIVYFFISFNKADMEKDSGKSRVLSGYIVSAILTLLITLPLIQCSSQVKENDNGARLEKGFVNPPDSAKPRVWWHWMNGNITKEGIKADLEWMHRVGIGGFQNFDAALLTPQIVAKRLVYMTPEWKDAFRFTTRLADSLGLEMAIAGSPGWSESGGPWVKPEEAMKKLVWSETRLEGGKAFIGILPKPPSTTGPIQNLEMEQGFPLTGGAPAPPLQYYKDVAVVAFRIPENDITMEELKPVISSSGGKFDLKMLSDGDISTTSVLPPTKIGDRAWILFDFQKPESIQSITLVGGVSSGMFGGIGDPDDKTLESSEDGKTFTKITGIPNNRIGEVTLTFAPVTARYFRVTFKTLSPITNIAGFNLGDSTPKGTKIAELVLHKAARVNRSEEKAAFGVATDLAAALTPSVTQKDAIDKSGILDLTPKMKPDGSLDWTPSSGKWAVLRVGFSLTGHKNGPASPEATGLEVDKLSAANVRSYFTNYLDQYKDATGGLMGKKGLKYMITDSWEAGTQNWTDNMTEDFKKDRGYDIIPWLPAIAGYIVESAEASDKFLWDFRRTIADLTAVNHYDQLTQILKERGMGRYTESHEDRRAFIGDGMEVKKNAAIPMSATWTPTGNETDVRTGFKADVRESASVAHIYGQNLVAAESMTAIGTAWAWSPESLKPTADMELASGLNRFVIHCSVHQPVNDKIPGLGLGPFGQWFTRHETWAENALPWTTYLARNCYMLQQGKFVADILYYYGEDNNITSLFGEKLPDIPKGYNFDFVNADALTHVINVNNGIITTPGGTSYNLLVLDANSRQMSLPVLKKLKDLLNAGLIIAGEKPLMTPSLSDDPAAWKSIADELWANEKGVNVIGKGKVFAGQTLKDVFNTLKIAPDFSYAGPQNVNLLYVHRKMDNIDLYWINNREKSVEDIEATFRVTGREAEIWHPETGAIERPSYRTESGKTTVSLHLQPSDAVFVVFRNKTSKSSFTAPKLTESSLAKIEGPWTVKFQLKRGAPEQIVLSSLTPWNENSDKGVKYFSGTGNYSTTFKASSDWLKQGNKLCLDLGSVKNLAEVIVNGKSLGIVWKTPFRVDISSAIKEGDNKLEIKVTNLWVNRLIGDMQPGATKLTYTTMPFYQANSPLQPSGLLGPVQLLSVKAK